MELGLQEPGATCNDCRWKIERKECPWSFDYDADHPYAEDCNDFRNIAFPESIFGIDILKRRQEMIELKLEPYCQNCSGFEAETRHQVLFSGADICEDMTTVLCENASKCARLYDYIQRNALNRGQENSP